MAIFVSTQNPAALLAAIKKSIDDKQVVTWSYDSDGDFTHDVDQWRRLAWLRPKVEPNRLAFGIVAPNNQKISHTVYGVYHGRFIEMLLTHHTTLFTDAKGTANFQSGYDII